MDLCWSSASSTNGGLYQTFYATRSDPYQCKGGPFETVSELRLVYGGDMETLNEDELTLSELVAQGVKKFTYEYDMGDGWRHTLLIEKSVPPEAGVKYPRCVDGKRACPPEDCGGPWGYGDFVAAIQDPQDERHEELLEWIGGEFDPEAFDIEAVNAELR